MAAIPDKWLTPTTELKLRAWAIDPANLDVTRGEIHGLIPDGCKVTEGYYTDARVSATIKVIDPSFQKYSWIRLVAEDSAGGAEELGTFSIGPIKETESGRGRITEYELRSAINAISEDRSGVHWVIGENTRASSAISTACDATGRPYVMLPGFNDYTSGSSVVYEIDDSFSSILFDVCDRSSNRMDVDGHGRLTFGPYVTPSSRGVDWEIDERDSRSIVISVDITEEDETADAYGRSIVVWKGRVNDDDEDDTEITATADVSPSHPSSRSVRGYLRAKVHSESEMSPASADRASQLARQYLEDDSNVARTGTMTVNWCPIHAGHVISLTRLDGSSGRWLVQTVDADLSTWRKKLTLKEA